MVLNPGKSHYMLIGNKSYDDKIMLNGAELKTINVEKPLGENLCVKRPAQK